MAYEPEAGVAAARPLRPPGAAGRSTTQSRQYHHRALEHLAGGVNSNVRLDLVPLFFAHAAGSRLVDVDENEYIDYALGMGPAILGHAPASVLEAVSQCLSSGQLFAGQHLLEIRLAELVKKHVASAERVRVGMTGSEMVQAALRVARAYTERSGFIKFEGHYHGWLDSILVNNSDSAALSGGAGTSIPVHSDSAGVPPGAVSDTWVLPWNDLRIIENFLQRNHDSIAAILTEPVMCNNGVIAPRPGYLEGLRKLCDRHGIVLIFDEVVTGFRLALGGAQQLFAVKPDLAIFAKAVGGGFPVALLAGRAEIMDLLGERKVNHAGTYNSNAVSVAAAVATIGELEAGDVFDRITITGTRLMEGISASAQKHDVTLKVTGYPSVFNTSFTTEPEIFDFATYKRGDGGRLRKFIDALTRTGIRPTSRGTWFVSGAHSQRDINETIVLVNSVLEAGV